jgi:hypothetical protein
LYTTCSTNIILFCFGAPICHNYVHPNFSLNPTVSPPW